MIKYALQCAQGHGFEAWFRDSTAFDSQAAADELACPACGSTDVRKGVMAPRIGKAKADASAVRRVAASQASDANGSTEEAVAVTKPSPDQAQLRSKLLELRGAIEASCDHVGPAFAEEARKIHYGESAPRGIYGETSRDEAQALAEEGIEVAQVPWISRGDA